MGNSNPLLKIGKKKKSWPEQRKLRRPEGNQPLEFWPMYGPPNKNASPSPWRQGLGILKENNRVKKVNHKIQNKKEVQNV